MLLIDILVFSDVFPLVIGGNIAHLLIKLSLAKRRPDFDIRVFLSRNWIGWVAGILISTLYAWAIIRGENQPPLVDFIAYGLMGSSLGKNLLKHMDNGKV